MFTPVQLLGITAFLTLYLFFLISASYAVFPNLPFKKTLTSIKPKLEAVTFVFAIIHAYLGLSRFSQHPLSLSIGLLSLILLGAFSIYSKILQKLIYFAGLMVVFHVVTITVHIHQIMSLMVLGYLLLMVLFWLETKRLDQYLSTKFHFLSGKKLAYISYPAVSIFLFWSIFSI